MGAGLTEGISDSGGGGMMDGLFGGGDSGGGMGDMMGGLLGGGEGGGAGGGGTTAKTRAEQAVKEIIDRCIEIVKQAKGQMQGAGKDMMAGLTQGIQDGQGGVESAVSAMAGDGGGGGGLGGLLGGGGGIMGTFTSLLGIMSPSRVFYGYGQDIAQGLVNGIRSSLPMVQDASRALAAAATSGQGGGLTQGLMSGGLLGGLLGGGGGFMDILQKVPSIMQNLNATGLFGKTTGNSTIENGAVVININGNPSPETVKEAKSVGPDIIRAILAGVGAI